jgi:alpha-beta hydrolase superfamily lysophospholipase
MKKPLSQKLARAAKIAAVVYVAAGLLLYFLQEKILFHPKELTPGHVFNFKQPFKEVNLAINNETNLNIVQFTVPDSLRKGLVLYFHGNRKNIERYAPYASIFTRSGYELWMMDYPGFGKSTGKLSEKMLYEDAAVIYSLARSRFQKDSIIIYGKSIGTGVASWLASTHDCKRLVLETPYYSIDALLRHYAFIYPVAWMTKYHFPNNEYFKSVEAPITIFHGTDDEVIPYRQAVKLAKENPGVNLVTVEGGRHNNLNDLPLFRHELTGLLGLP